MTIRIDGIDIPFRTMESVVVPREPLRVYVAGPGWESEPLRSRLAKMQSMSVPIIETVNMDGVGVTPGRLPALITDELRRQRHTLMGLFAPTTLCQQSKHGYVRWVESDFERFTDTVRCFGQSTYLVVPQEHMEVIAEDGNLFVLQNSYTFFISSITPGAPPPCHENRGRTRNG